MANEIDLIRKIDFFAELDSKTVQKIAAVCIPREYSTGERVIEQGQTGLGLFFITSGKVSVEVDKNGQKMVVAILKNEDFFGELSIIDNKPRSADVICLEDTRCLLLTRDSFLKLLNQYPEMAIQMAKALAERLRLANEKMTGQNVSTLQSHAGDPAQTTADVRTAPEPAPPPEATSGAAATSKSARQNSTKDQLQDFLVGTFSRLYMVKAFTRFSVALVGCPVTVCPQRRTSEFFHTKIGDIKIAVFPASQEQILKIDAYGSGAFSATVLRPESQSSFSIAHLTGRVKQGEIWRLYVPAGQAPLAAIPAPHPE